MKQLKNIFFVIIITGLLFLIYLIITTRNSPAMTFRQRFLKTVYPAFMWLTGSRARKLTNSHATPSVSFYSLKPVLNNGKEYDLSLVKGKKVLLVNTASNCGYTNQYEELQKLYEQEKDKLVILGFPANDFKEQEKGTDEEIARFCKVNFGVSFPLMKKSVVIKSADQNQVFKWLSDAVLNGWNNQQPSWNFSKYLVNENGVLTNYFDPSVSPLSTEVLSAIHQK